MRLEIGFVDVLIDALLEAREHVLKVLLLVAGRLFILDGHPRVFGRQFFVFFAEHRAEVDEIAVRGRLVADFHFGVFGLDLPFGLPGGRRHGDGRREHREGSLGALILGIVLGDARVDGSRFLRQIRPQQRVGQLEVRIDQLGLVAAFEGILHRLLAVAHAVGIEAQHLVHEVARMGQIARVLVARGREIELFDAAVAVSLFDQRFAQRLMRFRIVGVVGDLALELLDLRRGRRLLDVGEHERPRLITRAVDLIDPEVDEAGPAPTSRDRRVVFGLDEARMPWRRDLVDGERLVVDVMPRVGRGRLKIGLQLERRHLDDRLALARPRLGSGGRSDRTLRYHGLHARWFGRGHFAARGTAQRLQRRHSLLRGRRRGGGGGGGGGLDDVALEHEIRPLQFDSLVRAHLGNCGLKLRDRFEIEIRGIQLLPDRWRGRAFRAHLPEIRDRRLQTLEHAAAAATRRLIHEAGRLDFERLVQLGHNLLDELLGDRRGWWRCGSRWRRLLTFGRRGRVEIEKDKTRRLPFPGFAEVIPARRRRCLGCRRRAEASRGTTLAGVGAVHLEMLGEYFAQGRALGRDVGEFLQGGERMLDLAYSLHPFRVLHEVLLRLADEPLGGIELGQLEIRRLPRRSVAQHLVAHRDRVVVKPQLGVLVHRLVVVIRRQARILQLDVEIADAVVYGEVRIRLVLVIENLEPDLHGLPRILGLETFRLLFELLELRHMERLRYRGRLGGTSRTCCPDGAYDVRPHPIGDLPPVVHRRQNEVSDVSGSNLTTIGGESQGGRGIDRHPRHNFRVT